LSIIPDFRWDEKIHGTAETFVITVEDVDGEMILFSDSFVLRQRYAEDEHNVTITAPMFEPVPPNYYINVIADRWLHAETRLPISFKHLILPEKFPQPTALLELQPLPLSALHNKEFEAIYSSSLRTFNKIQTQVFQALYTSDENVFIGAPTGSGKTICAEFALLRLWSKAEQPRAVCIEPFPEMVEQRVAEWKEKFGQLQGGKEIVALTGETSADLRLLEKGDVIVCTPSQVCQACGHVVNAFDNFTVGYPLKAMAATEKCAKYRPAHCRRSAASWRRGWAYLRGHHLANTICFCPDRGENADHRLWCVTSQRARLGRVDWCFVTYSLQLPTKVSFPLRGLWFVFLTLILIFSSARPLDMDIHIQSFSIPHFPSLMIAMSKPAYLAIAEYSSTKPVIIFVPGRQQCRLTAEDLLVHCGADDDEDRFLNAELSDIQPHLDHISDRGLAETLKHGIGFYHEALSKQDRRIVERLFQSGAIQVLIASKVRRLLCLSFSVLTMNRTLPGVSPYPATSS